MTTHTRKSAVRIVIELRVRQPALRELRGCNARQRRPVWNLQRVTLFASLTPQELFGVGSSFCDPLCLCQNTHIGLQWFTAQIAARIAGDAEFRRMGRDVLLEFAHNKRVYHFRFIVWNWLIDALVECERMAARTSGGEFHRRHIRAGVRAARRLQCIGAAADKLVRIVVSDAGGDESCVAVGPRRG